nr:GIY-YIG nuclease family protein [uncultured Prevotella sp.]
MDIDKELEDIFNDPLMEVSCHESKLFDIPSDMKGVMKAKKDNPDYVARRRLCEDFAQFKPVFERMHSDLKKGKRQLKRVAKTASLVEGHCYIVEGQMVLLHSILETKKGANGLPDGRTRCIYENGTESDIFLQTLRKGVVANGYAITETDDEMQNRFFNADDVKKEDKVTGYIYVLRSLSDNPEIRDVKYLYKIGFTTQKVEERVANAEHEPTYLMAPVEIVSTYMIVNMHSQKFEDLVHKVLHEVNFRFKVADDKGEMHEATEWYQVPLEIIDSIIQKIMNGTIVFFSYNKEQMCLEQRIEKKQSKLDLSGLNVLKLVIKKKDFEQIVSGEKTEEYRELKQTTLNKYTYIDESDGKRYLKRYDVLRLCVGHDSDMDSAVVEVVGTTYNGGIVTFSLGKVLEVIRG